MKDDVLSDTILADEPSGQFMDSGRGIDTVADFFRYEWVAFARRLVSGQPLSPTIRDGCKSFHLTHAICKSLRNGGAFTRVEY